MLDEIENAGIFKDRVIESLQGRNKAVILVTHDPYLALKASRRIVMKHGGVSSVIEPMGRERHLIEELALVEDQLHKIREKIRLGAAFPSNSREVFPETLMAAVEQEVSYR